MTFDEYLTEVGSALVKHPNWRLGQTYFNVLLRCRPEIANALRSTEVDPFYDDARVTTFREAVLDAW